MTEKKLKDIIIRQEARPYVHPLLDQLKMLVWLSYWVSSYLLCIRWLCAFMKEPLIEKMHTAEIHPPYFGPHLVLFYEIQ